MHRVLQAGFGEEEPGDVDEQKEDRKEGQSNQREFYRLGTCFAKERRETPVSRKRPRPAPFTRLHRAADLFHGLTGATTLEIQHQTSPGTNPQYCLKKYAIHPKSPFQNQERPKAECDLWADPRTQFLNADPETMGTLSCLPQNSSEGWKAGLPNRNWLVRLLPSLTDLAFLLPVVCVLVLLRGPGSLLRDGDTGWHIRTGEWILAHKSVPATDLFSFTKAGQPWFAWEWGWDVCAAVIHGQWGLPGLVFANIALLCFASALLYRLVRKSCGNDLLAFVITAAAVIGSTLHWLARPHVASWLLLIVFCQAIQSARRNRWTLFWCLPVLSVLWTNIHGSFFVAPVMLLLFASQLLWVEQDGRASWRFAGCGVLCALASLINPYSWSLHRHLAAYLFDGKQLENISEYQPLNFHSPAATFVEGFLVLGCISLAWLVLRRRFADALWLGLWMHLGLRATRNVPIFLIVAAPLIAEMIQQIASSGWVSSSSKELKIVCRAVAHAGQDFSGLEAIPRVHLLSIGVLAMLALGLRADFPSDHFPVKAAGFLSATGASNVFTSDAWGGYIIYRLYPHSRVFVDGRSDFYGAAFDEQYVHLIDARYDWQQNLDRWPAGTVLLPVQSPLSSVLKQSETWSAAYDDGVAIVFARRKCDVVR